jgi:hypothetical protein
MRPQQIINEYLLLHRFYGNSLRQSRSEPTSFLNSAVACLIPGPRIGNRCATQTMA